MPWEINEVGERVYVPSIFINDELPSFSEMFDWFNLYFIETKLIGTQEGYELFTEVSKDLLLDHPYWNMSNRLCQLVMACNQLNKMILENGFDKEIGCDTPIHFVLMYMVKDLDDPIETHLYYLSNNPVNEVNLVKPITEDKKPPIYTLEHPSGKISPFISDMGIRTLITRNMAKHLIEKHAFVNIYMRSGKPIGEDFINDNRYGFDNLYPFFSDTFHDVVAELYKPYKEYYSKHKDAAKNNRCVSGFDPAI